jgi:hypothetical protein
MFALIALVVAVAPLSPSAPPMVGAEVQVGARSARLLDDETKAKLASLDARERSIQPPEGQKYWRGIGYATAALALLPVAAMVVGIVVGLVVGGVAYGFLGALAGLFAGPLLVALWIPLPVWIAAAVFGITSGISLGVANSMGQENRRELQEIRAARRALLHPTPMTTIATF